MGSCATECHTKKNNVACSNRNHSRSKPVQQPLTLAVIEKAPPKSNVEKMGTKQTRAEQDSQFSLQLPSHLNVISQFDRNESNFTLEIPSKLPKVSRMNVVKMN